MSGKGDLATRRLNWAARQWWRSERGSWFVNARGFNVTVFSTRRGYGIKVEQRFGSCRQFGKQRFATAAEAKERAFDALEWAAKHWGSGRYSLTNDRSRTTP